MNKKRFGFRSLYAKLVTVFLSLWWGLNLIILSVMLAVITPERLIRLYPVVKEVGGEFYNFKLYTIVAFMISIFIGTVIILLVVRGIIKPVKTLSNAARKVAGGELDVKVEITGRDELSHLADDFNTMAEELKSIDTMRNQFVSDVSHEFRTPITSIKGYAELLRDDVTHIKDISDEKKLQYCNIITDESNRLITLSGDLLRLSELDSKIIHKVTKFSLDEQIRKVIVLLEPQWSAKNITFNIDMNEIEYSGDKDLLKQLWINLIQNAIKFSYDEGIITILLHNRDNCFYVEIKDNGVGIALSDQSYIFDSFYMANKSRENVGNGLGLAIVKRIVEITGGRINVSSEPNKGTSFKIELPKQKIIIKEDLSLK